MDGKWKSKDFLGWFQDDMLTLASINSEPFLKDVRAKIDATYAMIKSGEFKPFTGPNQRQQRQLAFLLTIRTRRKLAKVNWYARRHYDEILA